MSRELLVIVNDLNDDIYENTPELANEFYFSYYTNGIQEMLLFCEDIVLYNSEEVNYEELERFGLKLYIVSNLGKYITKINTLRFR